MESPRLSPTIAHAVLEQGTLAAWAKHRLLGGAEEPVNRDRILGRAYHNLLLEGGNRIEKVDAKDYRAKAAREAEAEALAAGRIPMLTGVHAEAVKACAMWRDDLLASGFELEAGDCERRMEWIDFTRELVEVRCSGVPDWTSKDGLQLREFKVISGFPSDKTILRVLMNSHALLQHPAYTRAADSTTADQGGLASFRYVFLQSVYPFQVRIVQLPGDFAKVAEARWLRAMATWAKCLAKGVEREHWATRDVLRIATPGWLLNNEMGLIDDTEEAG